MNVIWIHHRYLLTPTQKAKKKKIYNFVFYNGGISLFFKQNKLLKGEASAFSYPDPSQFPNGKSKALVGYDNGSPRFWVVRYVQAYCSWEFFNQSNQSLIRLPPEPLIFRWETEKDLGTRMKLVHVELDIRTLSMN